MIYLVYIIISLLIIGLMLNQLVICFSPKIIEGATGSSDEIDDSKYTDPGLGNDPVYLSKLNASNIAYLKDQISSISNLTTQVDSVKGQQDVISKKQDDIDSQIKSLTTQYESMNKTVEANSYMINKINTSLSNSQRDSETKKAGDSISSSLSDNVDSVDNTNA